MRTNFCVCLVGGSAFWFAAAAMAEIGVDVPTETSTNKPGITVPGPTRGSGGKPAPGAVAQDAEVLKFKNGDTLHGMLVGVAPEGGLRWRHIDAKDTITFALANLAEVKLVPRGAQGEQPKTRAVVRLTNGDELTGEVITLNKSGLVLNTWYAGQMTIKRAMIESISPNQGTVSTLFTGPTSLDGWISRGNQGAWAYKKGALISVADGYLYRDVKLPDVSRIEFDLAWRGYSYFQFAFYSESGEDFYGNGYVLQMNGPSIYLQRGSPRRGLNNLGNAINVDSLQRKTKAHFVVLVNKPKKSITLMIDGEMVKQWTDPDEFAGKGSGIMFYGRGQNGAIKVSQISVGEWDGRMESDTSPANTAQEDLVRFVNNDKVSGTLDSIAKGELTFTSSYATLKIPLDRAAQISFAGDKAEKARRQANDVRAYFADGGRITLSLEKLDDKTLTGSSENWGQINFARDAFGRLQFRIYDEATESSGGDDDWAN